MEDMLSLARMLYPNNKILELDDTFWVIHDDNKNDRGRILNIEHVISKSRGMIDVQEGKVIKEIDKYIVIFKYNNEYYLSLHEHNTKIDPIEIYKETKNLNKNNMRQEVVKLQNQILIKDSEHIHDSTVLYYSKIEKVIYDIIMDYVKSPSYRGIIISKYKNKNFLIGLDNRNILITNDKMFYTTDEHLIRDYDNRQLIFRRFDNNNNKIVDTVFMMDV